jgi:predicted protein tyrosine phosphatase
MTKERQKDGTSEQQASLTAEKGSFIKPDVVKKSSVLPVTWSSYIEAEHVPWLVSEKFTDAISLEKLRQDTIDALGSNNIEHHSLPVMDADDGPYFSETERRQLVELVQTILKKQGAKVLIHCMEGKGRTPEAIGILEEAKDKRR